ncbi:DUF2989 domain-containing protein [Shewanella sedimentimangrovi]|uniref:DUF2989 domain-containing protein n=1 Tax=Shewanella sedimentimangrovi TaxID=2814293 RepID=UPI001E503668|nr:DUF2989 domain-containing protein [Shewanella sedimentimangrovi]
MSKNLVIFRSILSTALILTLIGCDNGRNSEKICKNNPELCEDLHKDSWCRYEKGDLIRNRYILKNTATPSGEQLYDQLKYLETYSKCVELAAGVQHIKHTDRTNDRLRAFGVATQNLQELQEHTKHNKDPHLAYYHWSRFNDAEALGYLLDADRKGEIKDPKLKAQLALYFIDTDPRDARRRFIELLGLEDEEHIDPDWLLALARISHMLGELNNEYIYSRANILLTGQKASDEQMLALIGGNKTLAKELDRDAETLAGEVSSGDFAGSEISKKLMAVEPKK